MSLNAGKTELLIFKHDLKVKIAGKRLYQSDFIKDLGVLNGPRLKWNYHTDFIAPKLTRALGMLTKVRHFVGSNTLRSVHFGFFSSIMLYAAQIWGQINKHVSRIIRLQDRTNKIINFASYNDSRGPLYKRMRIPKFTDCIYMQNFLFAHVSYKCILPFLMTILCFQTNNIIIHQKLL